MKKFIATMVKITVAILALIIIVLVIFWTTHPSETKQSWERGAEDAQNGVYNPSGKDLAIIIDESNIVIVE